MKLLICGGSNYSDREAAFCALELLPLPKDTIVIEGGATGGGRMGREWARARGFHVATVPALWREFGKAAGMRRNRAMMLLRPDYCVAFPGGRGTANMVQLCEEAQIPVWRPYG